MQKVSQPLLTPTLVFQAFFSLTNLILGRFFTAAAILRGIFGTSEVEETISQFKDQKSSFFVEWIPDNIKASLCSFSTPSISKSCCALGNFPESVEQFKRVANSFTEMLRRKAFIHWYTGEGVDEMEFTEAESNVNDLISEYQFSCDGCCCCEDEEMAEDEAT